MSKDMAKIKTTAKRNPITGDEVLVPAYARGRQTNFAGTDRKRESVSQQGFDSGMKKSDKADEKALMKDLNTWSRGKAKEMRKEDRVKSRESRKYTRKTTTPGKDKLNDTVNKVLGRGKYDRGNMGKNMSLGGNKSKLCVDKAGQKSQDENCSMEMSKKNKPKFKKQRQTIDFKF